MTPTNLHVVPGYSISHKICTWLHLYFICGYQFLVDPCEAIVHILQGCFTYTGAIIQPWRIWVKLANTQPQQNTTVKVICIIIGVYISSALAQYMYLLLSFSLAQKFCSFTADRYQYQPVISKSSYDRKTRPSGHQTGKQDFPIPENYFILSSPNEVGVGVYSIHLICQSIWMSIIWWVHYM